MQRAALSSDDKDAALEVVDAVEEQVASGRPKKSVVTALLASLPAVESITSIGKNIYDAIQATGQNPTV